MQVLQERLRVGPYIFPLIEDDDDGNAWYAVPGIGRASLDQIWEMSKAHDWQVTFYNETVEYADEPEDDS